MADVGRLLSGATGQIGRYFNVLSVLPSALLVTYVHALAASGAWTGRPDWRAAADSLSQLTLGGLVQLALISVLVGLVLHPLQYAFIQLLEGYWGTSRPAVWAAVWRVRHHRRRRGRLNRLRGQAQFDLQTAGQNPIRRRIADEHLPNLVLQGEAARLSTQYPEDVNDVRPTRLGNILRRHEMKAGSQYGLSAVVVIPHLAQVAPDSEVAHLDDQRTSLDLAVRLAVVAGLATCFSVVFLWRAGPWVLLGLVPYALMYAFYRGSVVVADGYGVAFSVFIDLNRFTLYERLGLRRPTSTCTERTQNRDLMRMLQSDDEASVLYTAGPTRDSAT